MSDVDPPKPTLEYDRSSNNHVTRGQFRLLLILMFINTVAIVGYLVAPDGSKFLRQAWLDFQSRRAAKAQQARRETVAKEQIAAMQRIMPGLMSYRFAGSQPVYTEDSAESTALLTSGGEFETTPVSPSYKEMVWQPPAFRSRPEDLEKLSAVLSFPFQGGDTNPASAPAFIHGRKNAQGADRLVICELLPTMHPGEGGDEYVIQMVRAMRCCLVDPGSSSQRPRFLHTLFLTLNQPDAQRVVIKKPRKGRSAEVVNTQVFRLMPGQADDKDASRFTIPFYLNGMPGSFAGRILAGDRLSIEPSTGSIIRRVRSSSLVDEDIWDPGG